MSSARLPLHIFSLIANELATERQTLSTLFLVSNSWYRAARIVVFRDVTIVFNAFGTHSERVARLLNILQGEDANSSIPSIPGQKILMILRNLTIVLDNMPDYDEAEDDWADTTVVSPAQASHLRTLLLLLSTAPNLQSLTLMGPFDLQDLGLPTLRALINLRCQAGTPTPSLKSLRLAGLAYVPPLLVTGVPSTDKLVTLQVDHCEGRGDLSPSFPFSETPSTPAPDQTDADAGTDTDTDILSNIVGSPAAFHTPPLQSLEVFKTSDDWNLSWILCPLGQNPTYAGSRRPRFKLPRLDTLVRRGLLVSSGPGSLQATLGCAPGLDKIVIDAHNYFQGYPAASGNLRSSSVTEVTLCATADLQGFRTLGIKHHLEGARAVLFAGGPMVFPNLQTVTLSILLHHHRPCSPGIWLKCHDPAPLDPEHASSPIWPAVADETPQNSLGGCDARPVAMIHPAIFDQVVNALIKFWPAFERDLCQQEFRKLVVTFHISPSDSKYDKGSSPGSTIYVPYDTWVRHSCGAKECRQVVQAVERLAGTLGQTQSPNRRPEISLGVLTYLKGASTVMH